MSILPIDEGRYGSPEMRAIFERGSRYQCFLHIEAALCQAQGELSVLPSVEAARTAAALRALELDVQQVEGLEQTTRHEVAAVVRAAADACGPDGRLVHFGATSSDLLDSATALQLKGACALTKARLARLLDVLAAAAREHQRVPMIGRTHGQHALPTTLGFKIANWLDELGRHAERLLELEPRLLVGKMSGAVGTMAGFGERGRGVEARVMDILGLGVAPICTQIVHRDRIAEFICFTAQLASTLDSMATEVRNLQRNEIGELAEPFADREQIGSSTMPQKRNPVLCENICSLARLLRGLVGPALENMVQWHERDLANSGNERFTIPQACILLDEILGKSIHVFGALRVDERKMQENLEMSKGRVMAEAVLLGMVRAGADRAEAYRALQAVTHHGHFASFADALTDDPTVGRYLSRAELEQALDANAYLDGCGERVEAVLASTQTRIQRLSGGR